MPISMQNGGSKLVSRWLQYLEHGGTSRRSEDAMRQKQGMHEVLFVVVWP